MTLQEKKVFSILLRLHIKQDVRLRAHLWGTNLDRASAPPRDRRGRGSAAAPRPGRIAAP